MVTARQRRGFALAVTLWVLVGGAALTLASYLAARDALGASRNRVSAARAYWAAAACEEYAHAAIREALWPETFTPATTHRAWAALDTAVTALGVIPEGCRVTLIPSGLIVDANRADEEQIRRAVEQLGVRGTRADSLVDAALDWRDQDDVARLLGAERDWYRAHGKATPRNAPLATTEELRSVRGFDSVPGLEAVLGVTGSRVLWTRAPANVLASLPGMTAEAVAVLIANRGRVAELSLLGTLPELSTAARDSFSEGLPALRQATTDLPDYWVVRSSASAGTPEIRVTIDTRIELADRQLRVAQRVVHS